MDHEEFIDPIPEETLETPSKGNGGDEIVPSDPEEPKGTSGWSIVGFLGLASLLIASVGALLASGFFRADPVPSDSPAGSDAFITIVQPAQGAVVPVPESIPIRGEAGGLFENSLVVHAFDSEGALLATEPTMVDAGEPGGAGNWSVDMVIPVKPGTKGLIFASSTSPADGSITASASVEVTYGEELPTGSEIKIDQPKDGAVLDTSMPVTVSGTGRGLFENNVVVQAFADNGDVMVQEPTTMQSEEVGGAGTWSIDIRILADEGATGRIRAFSTSPKDGSVDAEDTVSVQYGEEASPEATAEPPPDTNAGIEDLLWSLNSLGGIGLVPGSSITMDLTDGNTTGSAGCNTYDGAYELSGESISIGPLATTLKSCPEPPGLMDQENQYLTELQQIEAYSIQSDGLQMFGSQSPVTLFYNAVVLGTVGFAQPLEIPSGSTLTVQLQDASLPDASATVLSESVITDFSTIPIPFSISYDPMRVETRFTYSISARITDAAGNLIFINTAAYNVITGGNSSVVDVIVEPI